MDLGVAGRVALVTASSRGLGRSTARALASEGAKVVICARGERALREAETELAGLGEVMAVISDVTRPASPRDLVRKTVERFGAIDILVASAGGPPPGRALELSDSDLGAALNANLLTSVRLVREAAPHMQRGGWGRICLVASSTVRQPIPTLAASGAARAGLWGWAKPAASDLFGQGITLNVVCPGAHATERAREVQSFAEDEPVGDPDDFGQVVAFLCSEPARFITGTTVMVDGGRSVGL